MPGPVLGAGLAHSPGRGCRSGVLRKKPRSSTPYVRAASPKPRIHVRPPCCRSTCQSRHRLQARYRRAGADHSATSRARQGFGGLRKLLALRHGTPERLLPTCAATCVPGLATRCLQPTRFTNAYRASDRASQYLIRQTLSTDLPVRRVRSSFASCCSSCSTRSRLGSYWSNRSAQSRSRIIASHVTTSCLRRRCVTGAASIRPLTSCRREAERWQARQASDHLLLLERMMDDWLTNS